MTTETINNHAAFIWSVADLLRGNYKQSEYGKVILPLTVLRRVSPDAIDLKQSGELSSAGDADDTLSGGDGNDLLNGKRGNGSLDGGAGRNTILTR